MKTQVNIGSLRHAIIAVNGEIRFSGLSLFDGNSALSPLPVIEGKFSMPSASSIIFI